MLSRNGRRTDRANSQCAFGTGRHPAEGLPRSQARRPARGFLRPVTAEGGGVSVYVRLLRHVPPASSVPVAVHPDGKSTCKATEEFLMSTLAAEIKGRPRTQRQTNLWSAVSAALLGLALLYGVGFAPAAVHNAAHDARHAAAFPCH